MKVEVLQGINLVSPITTINIEVDGTPDTSVIDLVKSFHPVFMYEYTVEGKLISIRSKLPHLWKEAAQILNKQSLGEATFQETREYVVDYLIKNQVSSMSTIPILMAAQKTNLEILQAFVDEGVIGTDETVKTSQWNRYYRIGAGRRSAMTVSIGSSGDATIAFKIQRDKFITNTYIQRLALPIAPWEVIESEEHLMSIFDKYQKPVVIKPAGLTGGSGVSTNINTFEQAQKAYQMALGKIDDKQRQQWQRKVMIQQQVEGEDYRLLVINGKLQIATKRIPAAVVGDGSSTIRALIEKENMDPRRDISNPAHILKPINFDEMLDLYLQEQGLTLDHVPALGEKVQVRKVASMSQGGTTEDFTEKVHPQIRYIAESIATSSHAYVAGIDLICKDISRELTIENGSFIEMNTMPEAYLNAFPTTGTTYPHVGEMVIEGLLANLGEVKQVVYIGDDSLEQVQQQLAANGVDIQNERWGVVKDGTISVNGTLLSSGIEPWKAIEALKINRSLSVIVLQYSSVDQIKQLGTGFDKIDLMITSEDEPTFRKYEQDGLIGKVVMK